MKIGILWYIDGICNLQRDLVGVSLDYFKVTTTGFLVFDRKKRWFPLSLLQMFPQIIAEEQNL